MSSSTINVLTCDRCGTEAQFREHDRAQKVERDKWSRIHGKEACERVVVGSDDEPADLCPVCTRELEDFMDGAKPRRRARPTAIGEGERP